MPVSLIRLVDEPGRTACTFDSSVDLRETARALVNVGSVGQPRDEDPRAAYALYDTETRTISIRRVAYDIDAESQRIREAGLPSMLADRLYLGV